MHVRNRQVGGMRAWERHKLLPYYHIKCWAIYISQLAPRIPVLWTAKLASIIFQTFFCHTRQLFFDKWSSSTDSKGEGKQVRTFYLRDQWAKPVSTSNSNTCIPRNLGTAVLKTELAALALLDLPLLHLLTVNSLLLFHCQDSIVPAWAVLPIIWIDKSPFLYFHI